MHRLAAIQELHLQCYKQHQMRVQFPAHRTLLVRCIELEGLHAGPSRSSFVHPRPIFIVRVRFLILPDAVRVMRCLGLSGFPTCVQFRHLVAIPIPSACQNIWFLLIFRVQVRRISGGRARRRCLTSALRRCRMRSGVSIAVGCVRRCGSHRCGRRGWSLKSLVFSS